MAMVGVASVSLQAYRWTHSLGFLAWSEGRQPLSTIPQSSYDPLAVALSYNDSTINIVVIIIII